MSENERLSPVFESADPIRFSLAENRLQQAGIPFVARDAAGGGSATAYIGLGVPRLQTLWVHPGDEERALTALEVFQPGPDGEADPET